MSNVYNISPGQSFVDALAQGIWDCVEGNPLTLSEYTILLPSRRACRVLREAFLRLSKGQPLLLPRMQPLGDVDADELGIALSVNDDLSDMADIPPSISRMRRQILLAHMIMKMPDIQAEDFDQAARLAAELGNFLDQVQTERIGFDKLQDLVPEAFAEHWQITLEFLRILTEHWPNILSDYDAIDYADRRNKLLEAQTKLWQESPPNHPIIAAGSTGSIPATRDLLIVISQLPQGSIVLPGLDQYMDENSWDRLGEDHPQYSFRVLLNALDIGRQNVKSWEDGRVNKDRAHLLSEIMRPSETAEAWQNLNNKEISERALEGFSRIDCSTQQEEADVIALMMREVLETPEKTAALVTPDRNLARRVGMSLQRWDIEIDDSGGRNLSETVVGSWLRLTARMILDDFAPVPLLACLKHPFAAAGQDIGRFAQSVRIMERYILRGPRPEAGIEGLYKAIEQVNIPEDSLQRIRSVLESIEPIVKPYSEEKEKNRDVFSNLLSSHIEMAESLAATDQNTGAERIWKNEDGENAAQFISEFYQVANDIPPLDGYQYLGLLNTLMGTRIVRPLYGTHPRLSILGQLEGRLYNADLVILGGLNEGTWPADPPSDPWMSRPMRKQFGLPSPEYSIGLSAHDFVQAATAPNVVITRSKKDQGAETIPARWLLRMDTVLQGLGMELPQRQAEQLLYWVNKLDEPESIEPCKRPAPRPPVEARPRKLSVTRIERWMRDPYEIYASYILKLRALDPIDADPGAAEKGTVMHLALEQFVKAYPQSLPADAYDKLLEIGHKAFDELKVPLEVKAFWWPRFENMARKYLEEEHKWRKEALPIALEASGEMTINNNFKLTAKADRIDKKHDGSIAIIDYKTGEPPKEKEIASGLSPQLPLEAAIVLGKGFPSVMGDNVSHLSFWKVSGGKIPVEIKPIKNHDVMELAKQAKEGLENLVKQFDSEDTPYTSRPRPDHAPRYSDYEHLARVKEWATSGEGDT